MPITFIAAAGGDNSVSTSVLPISVPSGTANGDVMLLGISQRGNFSALNFPAQTGWTLIREDDEVTHFSQGLWYRVASSEPASYNFDASATPGRAAGSIMTFRGVDTASPIDAHGGQATSVANVNCVAPSISPVGSSDMLAGFFCTEFQGATFTPPTGMTEAYDGSSGAGTSNSGCSIEATYQILSASGATGTRTAVCSDSRDNCGQLVALKDAASNVLRLLASLGVGI